MQRPTPGVLVLLLAALVGCEGASECESGSHLEGETCVLDAEDPDASTDGVGNDVRLDRFPPVVVHSVPESGALGVDPALDRIEIQFSRPMGEGWSWVNWEGFAFPTLGTVAFESPTLHVASGIALDPDTGYLAWLNAPSGTYEDFTDTSGQPLLPFPLAFHTGDGTDPAALDGFPPAVIAASPAPGAEGVDPLLDRIELTFSRDMFETAFGWGFETPRTFPETLGERFEGPRKAVLDVRLEPGTTYAIWINDEEDGFVAVDGVPAAPYVLAFRTAEPER